MRNLVAFWALWLLLGCSKPAQEASSATVEPTTASPQTTSPPALAEVNHALKDGSYDDAAARLLELQSSGRSRSFNPREAAQYRKAMNEAYTRALEAAEKGDKRAEAALQMIRAAGAN